jgi:hypothetical protein
MIKDCTTKITLNDLRNMDMGPYVCGDIIGFLRWDKEGPYLGVDNKELCRIVTGNEIKVFGDGVIYEIV